MFRGGRVVQVILLMGYQATGKSTFCRERLFRSHLRINLDMLKTRHREWELVTTCLRSQTAFVLDNTNLTRRELEQEVEPLTTDGCGSMQALGIATLLGHQRFGLGCELEV